MRIDVTPTDKLVIRTAGIFVRNQQVLLHRAEHEDIWALPGGGCEFFEDTKEALTREMTPAFTNHLSSLESKKKWKDSIGFGCTSSGFR
jgi:hypothetical protein